MAFIVFDQVSHKFGDETLALDNVSCEIEPGEMVFLVGPSGSGKTTFLRLLLRELRPTQGKIMLDNIEISNKKGICVPKLRRQIGASFQDVKLLMDRTIFENIAMAMEIVGKKPQEIKEAVEAVLDLVDLTDKADKFPVQLSGGEIQRIGIARAVVGDPVLIFADEPTANLDDESAWKIASLLKEINRSGKTVIVATHNLDMVNSMGERVMILDKGKLAEDKKAKKYKRKKDA
ncbi:ATP-binding cassette domain-containing protein [Candidatus Beckwithbacteria bacterium]|nr:ATP-binding cassette domain-containing protein [Candidatus Beckwithbacteria bacterium]